MKKKKQTDFTPQYPLIYSIGLCVVEEPYPHVPGKLLRKALRKAKITRQFNKNHGVNTAGILDNGEIAIYPCDIERTLKIVLQNYKPKAWEWD